MGGCKFLNCGMEKYLLTKHKQPNEVTINIDGNIMPEVSPSCNGGMCEFTECANPSCKGGACIFINCVDASCDGGGCKFINPKNTIKENYCKGGGCVLNGKVIPSSWKNQLVY